MRYIRCLRVLGYVSIGCVYKIECRGIEMIRDREYRGIIGLDVGI